MQHALLPFTLLIIMLGAGFSTGVDDEPSASDSMKLDVHPAAFVDRFELSFELNDSDSVVLGIYDRSSRQVYRRDLGRLGPGDYVYEIAGSKWEAGSHLVIITGENGRTASTNVIKIGEGAPAGGSPLLPPIRPNPDM